MVDELPGDARAVLLTPAHQFPTGAVLSAERRAELLRWADERDALIIEDDYDAEYRYDRAPVGALQGLRPDLVAHVGSVSKTLAPALRLGLADRAARLARAPPRGARVARPRPARRSSSSRSRTSSPAAPTTATCGARGRAYRRRRDALIEALDRALPDATVSGAAAGPAHRRPHPGRRRARARRGAAARRASSSTASRRTASRPARAGILISFAAVPDAAAGHVAELIASAL